LSTSKEKRRPYFQLSRLTAVIPIRSPPFTLQVARKKIAAIPRPPGDDINDNIVSSNDTAHVSKTDIKRYKNLVAALKELQDCYNQSTRTRGKSLTRPHKDVKGAGQKPLLLTKGQALNVEAPLAKNPSLKPLKRRRSPEALLAARKKQKKLGNRDR
jgi:hypothetical protein